jgi:multiple sugar transport system substrate-binding protein
MRGMQLARAVVVANLVAVSAAGFCGPSSAEDKLVRVWHTETEPQTIQAFNGIARRFEAGNPGIKIEAQGLAWADLEGKIMAALAAGNPPELSHGQPITCTALQAKGLLNPLDEVVKTIGEANIWEQVKRVCNVNGKQYGLVHAAGTSLLIYRRDMADKIGLKPPKTWADLVANAKALTQDLNGDGKIDIYGITLPGDNLFINIILGEMITANGGALFDKRNRPLLTDRRMVETLQFWRRHSKISTAKRPR